MSTRRRLLPLLLVVTLAFTLGSTLATAESCGLNGQCTTSASCANWNTQNTDSSCPSGQVCCEPPTCLSSEQEAGVCRTTSSCTSGRILNDGQCTGGSDVACCLAPLAPTKCSTGTSTGTCGSAASCTTGRTQTGLCGATEDVCCLPTAPQSCVAQGMTGVCQVASSSSCASGNTVEGICDDASQTCCLPQAVTPLPTATCSAQQQNGTCQASSVACPSGNSVTNVCANGLRCCLPNPPPASSCSAQGMTGTCKKVSECTAGHNLPGLCPGDATIQCCLPKPPSFGTCTTSTGFIGTCTGGSCSGATFANEDICPGGSAIKCCVTDFAPRPPPPAIDYGKCVHPANGGSKGTCKSIASCVSESAPVAGLCPGPNDIQCCSDNAPIATPVWNPAKPAAGTFFGACQTPSGPGSCKPTSAGCTAGAPLADLCPAGSSSQCCPDGGPSYINGIDLPGGVGAEISSATLASVPSVANLVSCLKTSAGGSHAFLLARGWQSTCQLDKTVVATLNAAATAGLPSDVMLYPAVWCGLSPKAQAMQLLSAITDSTFGRIWISVEDGAGWSASNLEANLGWVLEASDAIASTIGGARVGIVSSKADWEKIMGTSVTATKLNDYPLWYVGNTNQVFQDFVSFGGWAYPYAKRVTTSPFSTCGTTIARSWLPSKSSTVAAAGTAPAAEATGVACSVNSVAGTCQSIGACTKTSAAGVCADSSKVCCLTGAPQLAPAPTPQPPRITYGLCRNMTGVCQPRAQCDSTDTKYDGETDCVPTDGLGDTDVTCCVPTTPIPMPPTAEEEESTPSPSSASASVSKSHHRHSLAATSTSTTSSAANVCINKAGLELIESFEGFYANFYLDAVGIKTIGFGTACHAYPCDTLKPPLTRQQAENVLLADMTNRYAPCVRNWIKVPLNSNQFSALVSFVYNVGCGGLQGSVGKQLNAGCYSCVPALLNQWNKAGGKVLAGLTRRRAAEGALFMNGNIAPCLSGSGSTGHSSGQSWGSCKAPNGKAGTCIEAANCDDTTYSGLCPGPASVKCCVNQAANPPPPAADACGNGGTCKKTTSCNTGTHTLRSGLCPGDSTIKCCQPKSSAASDGWWEGATRDPMSAGSAYVNTIDGIAVKPKIVLHTTEGGTWEGARSAYTNTHPHFTVTFQKGFFQAYQHCSILTSAKALKHPAGTVHTNLAKAVQIEIVGQAVKAPNFDRKYLDGIATLLRWIEGVMGIPKRSVQFLPYPSSYGNSPVRLSASQWISFSGTLGHQHVPVNSHGDPGNLDINYLMGTPGTVWPAPSGSGSTTPGTNGQPGDFGTCTSQGRQGVCQDKSACGGTVVTGLCAGGSNIACCIENYGSCSVAATATTAEFQGTCQEASKCTGKKVSGLCPGPSSVTCCVADYGSCAQGTTTGRCTQVNDCKGTVVPGLCSGPSSVACCMPKKVADFGSCQVTYGTTKVTGQCIAKSSCASPMVTTPGLCPGDSSVSCCHNPSTVRTFDTCGTNGQCMDINSCSGSVKRGLCAGASNIICCENNVRAAAAVAIPVNSPRSLFAVHVVVNDTASFAPAPPQWTAAQLTLCTAGGQQGFCMDGSVGNAVCNGVPTFPSSCESPAVCCTPQPCQVTNTTSGICIPPTECSNQAGFSHSGDYCGVGSANTCCSGVGLGLCDSQGLLGCLLAGGDPTACAASFNCPPVPDYAALTQNVQSAPFAGMQAHANVSDVTPAAEPDDGNAGALVAPNMILVTAIAMIITAMIRSKSS